MGSMLSASDSAPYNHLVSELSGESLEATLVVLGVDLVLESAVAAIIMCKLRMHGFKPLQFLYGVICAGGYSYYLAAATTSLVWYASLQLVHSGCDYSLKFPWARGSTT